MCCFRYVQFFSAFLSNLLICILGSAISVILCIQALMFNPLIL